MHLAKWLNGGTRTWNHWYGGFKVLLFGVVELITRGFVWVMKHDSDLVASSFSGDMDDNVGSGFVCVVDLGLEPW